MYASISRSKELLNKVYDRLDSIDVSKLSMREISDFLEVVQKGQKIETTDFETSLFPLSIEEKTNNSNTDILTIILLVMMFAGPCPAPNADLTAVKKLLEEIKKEQQP